MKVFVIGATGVLGSNVLPRLLERGHEVQAVVRRPDLVEKLMRLGVEAAVGDILDIDSLAEPLAGCDAALHLATAIPKSQRPEDWEPNDKIRREGTYNLLAAASQAGVKRYVQQSVTFLYGDQGQRLTDEETPFQPAPRLQSAADMEKMVQASSMTWCILRGGALYGPQTGTEETWKAGIQDGTLRLPAQGTGFISLVHAADFAQAAVLAAERAPAQSIFNVVDDRPVTYQELYGHIAALIGAKPPDAGGPAIRSLACSNTRLKEQLGWSPSYSTYHSGIVK